VSGPASDWVSYLSGGITTFRQLNLLCMVFFNRRITEFNVIADWGVGCGRVFRQFIEDPENGYADRNVTSRLLGFDIDKVNVDWCRENLTHVGQVSLLSTKGFDLDSNSVDLLYGISVMTHLSEINQGLWLREIARVVKPGGAVILTTHGEVSHYQSPSSVALPFIETFGFFDGIPDEAIGKEMNKYYRATYHDRVYLEDTWSLYFDILDVIPAANAFRQDFVVMRRKSS